MAKHPAKRKGRGLNVADKVVKDVITGKSVPKSLSMIELEKNYVLLAKILSNMIDRMQNIESTMENLEKKMARTLRDKKTSSL